MSISSIPRFGLAGLGVCLGLASQARAGDSYGHAEITLGFPAGQVTVGHTWDTGPREVVVERVTHKLPDPDYDDEVTPRDDDETVSEGDADADVIVEKRVVHHHHRRVVVVENRYDEPEYCEPPQVVRRVYVEPSCRRSGVVVYRAPERVIYAPSRIHFHESRGGGYRGGSGYDRGPRNLFPEDSGRPTRMRGVQRVAVR